MLVQYLQHLATHGTNLNSFAEFNTRHQAFKASLESVERHNASDAPFKMALNKFSDLQPAEFISQSTGGAVKRIKSKTPVGPSQPSVSGKNWYSEGFVTKPKDQGGCGACWAFTAASTLESLAFIKGFDTSLQTYSIQQLVDCDTNNFQCEGGWMFEAYQYTQQHGIALEADYPRVYEAQTGACHKQTKVHFYNHGQEERDGLTNEELQKLVRQQPIGVAIYGTGMLQNYSHGILTESYLRCSDPNNEVNHGVVLVGFGQVDSSQQSLYGQCREYWVVRNSWSSHWGEDGFFRLCMDGAGSPQMPLGPCLINAFAAWPTL